MHHVFNARKGICPVKMLSSTWTTNVAAALDSQCTGGKCTDVSGARLKASGRQRHGRPAATAAMDPQRRESKNWGAELMAG